MGSRLRDAILALIVGASLVATGWAFYGLGRRLPPPPEVRPAPAPRTAPDAQHLLDRQVILQGLPALGGGGGRMSLAV